MYSQLCEFKLCKNREVKLSKAALAALSNYKEMRTNRHRKIERICRSKLKSGLCEMLLKVWIHVQLAYQKKPFSRISSLRFSLSTVYMAHYSIFTITSSVHCLKGQSHEIFRLWLFSNSLSLAQYTALKGVQICSNIGGEINTLAIASLLVLTTGESAHRPEHHLEQKAMSSFLVRPNCKPKIGEIDSKGWERRSGVRGRDQLIMSNTRIDIHFDQIRNDDICKPFLLIQLLWINL